MYTQCPDCDAAFPVTARVLQQAAGQVRCGRCGRPFNALERLSEDPPGSGDGRADSRSMLDALEALAGPEDIRIEDTGVEWRVVDEDDIDAADSGAVAEEDADEADRSSVRWYLEDADQDATGNDASSSGTGDEGPRHHESEDEAPPVPHRPQRSLQLPTSDGEDELRYDDNTPLPEDFGQDVEPDGPPRRRAEDFIERSPEFEERQVDLALGEPGEWMALLDELGTGEDEPASGGEESAAVDDPGDSRAADLDDTDIRLTDDAYEAADADADHRDFPRDIDTQFDLQAVEMGIELTGSRALAEADEDDEAGWALADADPVEPETPSATMTVEPSADDDALEFQLLEDEPAELELATDTDTGGISDLDDPVEPPGRVAWNGDDYDEQPPEPASSAAEETAAAGRPAEQEARHEPAPMTEEELTINRLIDQDLMRFAEEQDALASTAADAHRPREAPHVETIIMEGDFVRTALEDDEDESAAPAKPAGSEANQDIAGTWLESRPQAEEQHAEPRSRKALAGIVMLGVLLLVQVLHTYREALATNGAFERAAAPVYRLLGAPLVPGWDARGWRFEATSGGTDASGEVLSISSQIANESDRLLPYPLIYLSLTDRWEEPVGASVLEPAEYLAPDTEATSLVPPGESFTANIIIRSLSPDASGFKLNVCYPAADAGSLRCAIEDFRK